MQALTLAAGSVWNVTEESHLDCLAIGEGITINGTVTVDGVEIEPVEGIYEGEIVVTPAAGAAKTFTFDLAALVKALGL